MMIHFLRPYFLLGLIPTAYLFWRIWQHQPISSAWSKVCDPHLLHALMEKEMDKPAHKIMAWLLLSALLFLWIAAAGPAWRKLSVPLYAGSSPKMIVLDISKSMLAGDVTPDRLQRAKFVIQDILDARQAPPIGMIAYTQEPFIVSPLTDDTQTISALLPSLDTDTAPVGGQNLSQALEQAAQMMQQTNDKFGAVLVLTGTPPDEAAQAEAAHLHQLGLTVSVLHISHASQPSRSFTDFAQAGGGLNLSLTNLRTSLAQWLNLANQHQQQRRIALAQIPRWQDEGRWFIIPALCLLAPVFQRGRLRSITG